MRNLILILLICLFMGATVSAQVKIGDNPQNIDPSSVLELESTDKVLVITRVTTAQMNAIVPSQGALCFNTDLQSVHYYDGTQWVNIGGGGTGGPLTADPIVNTQPTIVITPTATGDNLEVAPNSIRSEQIVDGGINGVDIQDGSIGQGKLQDNSVTQEKLSENSVGAFALDNDNIGVSAFNNDAGYITAGDITSISADAGNAITAGSDGGAFYDDTDLLMDVMDNAADIAADNDQSPANEIQNPTLTGTILGLTNTAGTVDLGPLISAGGSDDQNIGPVTLDASNVLSIGIENGMPATVDLSSLAGTGSTEVVDGTTLTGVGTAVDPFKIEPGANGQVLTTDPTGVVWANVTPGGGTTEVVDGTTLTGVGTAVDPFKIEPSTTNGQFLSTDATGTVAWADLPPSAGAALFDPTTISGTGILGDEYTVADDGITTAKILDANVTTTKIAPAADLTPAADQMLITTDAGVVEWAPLASHTGTANSVFFADDTTGAPTEDNDSFAWDQNARLGFGQLQIGLDGNTAPTDVSKVVIAETPSGGTDVMYPLLIQTSAAAMANASTGILFSPETHGPGTLAKGALIYQRTGAWATGDFHFLQTALPNLVKPTTADKAFTVRNNKDIVLYGGIEIDGLGLGTNGQVLTSTGSGVQWNSPTAGAVTTDATINGDGSLATPLSIANDAITTGRILDGEVQTADIADNNVIPAKIAEGTSGQVLTTDAVGDVVWAAPAAGAVSTDATIDGDGSLATPLSIANGAVSGGVGGVIVDNSITAADLDADSVDASEIRMDAVGLSEIEDGAVASGEIVDGSIENVDISTTAAIDGDKINPVFTAQITANGGISVGADILMNGNMVVPDYVFQKYFLNNSNLKESYNFLSLEEIEAFVKKYNHLPGIKSAEQVKKDGVWNLNSSNLQNLEKIEELFLHTIEQENKIKALKSENDALKEEVTLMKKDLEEIKKLLKDK